MRVVVTGGTGFIGTPLVAALARRGDSVTVLNRRAGSKDEATGVRFVSWTPEKEGEWGAEIDGADAVVHLAGAGIADKRWNEERLALIRSSRVESTKLVAAAIARARKRPSVLVSASAVGYYGMRSDDAELDESSTHGDDLLARLVVDWERAAETAQEAGVRVAHPRMGVVLGKEGGALAKMLPAFKAFVGGPVGRGTQWVSWIHRDDAIAALLFALDRDVLAGPFVVTAPAPVTMNTFAREVAAALHRPAFFRVPAFALKLAVGEGVASLALTGPRVLPARLLANGFDFRFGDLAAALRDLLRSGE
jgi:uncharacterized protein (TIGR01777 family)